MSIYKLHIGSLNVQVLRAKPKRLRFLEWVNQQKLDISFLQETHFTNDILEDVKTDFKDYRIYNAFGPTTHSKGCTKLVRKICALNIMS
jgi:exonuclease III